MLGDMEFNAIGQTFDMPDRFCNETGQLDLIHTHITAFCSLA